MATFSATYVDTNEFTVSGDVRTYFPVNVAIRANCGGTWVYTIVDTVSYAAPNTTVTVKTTDLSSPISAVEVSTIHPWGVPWHNHEDHLSGGNEVVGAPPDHSWSNNKVRFTTPGGSWGSYQAVGWYWRGAWATSTSYDAYDCVLNNGVSYICISSHSSDATSEPGEGTYWETYWDQLISGLVWRDAWVLATDYNPMDIVTNDGSVYICSVENTSDSTTEPGTGTYWEDYWSLFCEQGPVGPTGPQGDSIVWRGVWSGSGVDYSELDAVFYNDVAYICILDHSTGSWSQPGVSPTWTTYWDVLATAGTADNFVWKGDWLTATDYYTDDITYNDGSSYICVSNHNSGASTEPGVGASWEDKWNLFAQAGTGAEFNWAGQWNTEITYALNDFIVDPASNCVFICILGHTSTVDDEPFYGVNWETYWEAALYGATYGISWAIGDLYWPNYLILKEDGNVYCCMVLHTGSEDKEPGVGVDWENYWYIFIRAFTAKGDWETSTWYLMNDVVGYDGQSYVCLQEHTSDETTEPTVGVYWEDYWALFADKGADGVSDADLLNFEGTAGATLAEFDLVYADSTDSDPWKKAQSDGTEAEAQVVGIVIEAGGIADTDTGTIQWKGKVTNAGWSWTGEGKKLYLSATAGAMTETAPTSGYYCWVATTLSATEIIFDPKEAWLI